MTTIQRRPAKRFRSVRAAGAVTALASSADNFVLFLLLWIAQPQGWSAVQTAVVVLALRVPTLATGVLLGRAVDRWGGRRLILLDLTCRAVLLLLLMVSCRSGTLLLVPVLVLGGLSGALAPATYTGVRWLVPRLVDTERLGRANAVVGLGDQVPLVVGTALVGPSLALFGPVGSMAVPAGMLLAGAALAVTLPAPGGPVTSPTRRPDTARRSPPRVFAVIALSTSYYFAYGPFETASPPFVRSLGGTAGTYSLLWTLFGVGALATLPLGPVLSRHRPGLVNALGALVWGVVMLPIAVVHDVLPAAVLFLIGGAVWGPYTTIETSALQRWVPPGRHRAVFGLQRSLLSVAIPLGAALAAIAQQQVSSRVVLAISAAGCACAGLLALANRDLRRAP